MGKKLYHVDKRLFNSKDVIVANATYDKELLDECKQVEDILNETCPCPQILPRSKNVFLFDSLLSAFIFFKKYGGNIYEVTVNPSDILCRCDMNKIDNILDIVRFTNDSGLVTTAANEYWKPGTHTFLPCYEYLVQKCTAKRMLVNDNQRVSFLSEIQTRLQRCPPSPGDIENTTLYREVINSLDANE